MRVQRQSVSWTLAAVFSFLLFAQNVSASLGDRLPEFKECVKVCIEANCGPNDPTPIPLHHRLLFWTCPSTCDYTCQHIVTDTRLARDPPYLDPIVQYHGKWPFYRFLGIQEPFSVLFSFFNYAAHSWGIAQILSSIPASYLLRKYYLGFGYCGLASWTFSMIFHTRDSGLTEKLDYFAAGMSVMYGLYYTPISIWRLPERPAPYPSIIRLWTLICLTAYLAHISYLTFVTFDYGYNMLANIVVGIIQNVLWSGFSIVRYKKMKKGWAAWPGLIVAWIIMAMSLELLDFPPFGGMLDAHSLWHLGTVGPTIWWYQFLLKDAQEDLQNRRFKL